MSVEADWEALDCLVGLLDRDERRALFDLLYRRAGGRPQEKIAMMTGIQKTHVYRYKEGRMVPGCEVTCKVLRALLRMRCEAEVSKILGPAATRMRRHTQWYISWEKSLRRSGIVYDPLSRRSIERLEDSQRYRDG